MAFNALDVFLREKRRYVGLRGGTRGPRGKAIPKTTWRDVYMFGAAFLAQTSNYASLACNVREMQLDRNLDCPKKFVETHSYKSARMAFESQLPFVKLWRQNPMTAPALLAAKSAMNEEYPWNTEFWETANRYAMARNAAGMVQGKWTMAREAIIESVAELPENIAGGIALATDVVGSGVKKLLIWGAVAVAVFILGPPLLKKVAKKLES
ncbi:MAG: hypothetical protein ACYSWU_00090 [Planctomycetota bacterium]|jgi:hypothetical protein